MKHLSLFLVLLFSLSLFAAEEKTSSSLAFGKGDNVIGVGFAFDYDLNYNNGNSYSTSRPGVGVIWDHGFITDFLSIGAGLDSYFDSYNNGNDVIYYMSPSFRFGFHPFGLPPLKGEVAVANVLDPYVTAYAGFMTSIYDGASYYDFDYLTDPYVGVNLGVRWYITPSFGLMAEGDWNHVLMGVHFGF